MAHCFHYLAILIKYNCYLTHIGGPGSGKGTQCARIVEKFGFVHLSTGDLFRAEVKKDTKLGQTIANIIKEGALVSSVSIQSFTC